MNIRKIIPIGFLAAIFIMSGGDLIAQQKHKQKPADDSTQAQEKSGTNHDMPGMNMDQDMPGMKMGEGSDGSDHQAESGAVSAMSHMHHHQMGPHMYMTALRPSTPKD